MQRTHQRLVNALREYVQIDGCDFTESLRSRVALQQVLADAARQSPDLNGYVFRFSAMLHDRARLREELNRLEARRG
jgi:hypothetical protein